MPPTTAIQTFIDALRTKQTRMTQVLEHLANGLSAAEKQELAVPDVFGGSLNHWPSAVRRKISQHIQNPAEIAHLQAWPSAEREKARRAIADGVASGDGVVLRWDLGDGNAPITEVQPHVPGQPYVVTFRSPRSNLRWEMAQNEVFVDP